MIAGVDVPRRNPKVVVQKVGTCKSYRRARALRFERELKFMGSLVFAHLYLNLKIRN